MAGTIFYFIGSETTCIEAAEILMSLSTFKYSCDMHIDKTDDVLKYITKIGSLYKCNLCDFIAPRAHLVDHLHSEYHMGFGRWSCPKCGHCDSIKSNLTIRHIPYCSAINSDIMLNDPILVLIGDVLIEDTYWAQISKKPFPFKIMNETTNEIFMFDILS